MEEVTMFLYAGVLSVLLLSGIALKKYQGVKKKMKHRKREAVYFQSMLRKY